MTRDFSYAFNGKQNVRNRPLKLSNAGFLAKKFGVVIVGVMLCGFCGSMFMGWMIRSELNELAQTREAKQELIKMKQNLVMEKKELLAKNNIEEAAGALGLYPVKPTQVVKRF